MSKFDEIKGKVKAVVDNTKDEIEDAKEDLERKADEAKGYEEARDR